MFDRLEKLISAVESNNIPLVRDILIEDRDSKDRIPSIYLAGALVIAAEHKSIECVNKILEFNLSSRDRIPEKYIHAALVICDSAKCKTLH